MRKKNIEQKPSDLIQVLKESSVRTWTSSDGKVSVKYKRPTLSYIFKGGNLPAFFTEGLLDMVNNETTGTTSDRPPITITPDSMIEMEKGTRKFAIDTIIEPKFHEGENDEVNRVYSIDLFSEYVSEYFNSVIFNLNDIPVQTTNGPVSAGELATFPDSE